MLSTHVNNAVILEPPPRLDAITGLLFYETIAALVSRSEGVWLVDMTDVVFVDSRGLLSLVRGLRLARQGSCRLVLCNVKPTVRLIFEITQLDRVFEIFEGREWVENPPILVGA
ncbi:STAS domain-containing protein [Ancylothrix sp. C2]|uniref:STAS domain-containing protein n=1 Tax=Ancylothrix sp. D3o TaxID=2953691 RepID=UPI0021BA7675|nr:STAS domain-containing protein [Ancylothrix sp. D3o]MCT7951231.1 STAS domain-containing protein [Ancylothrix sp. D3o]